MCEDGFSLPDCYKSTPGCNNCRRRLHYRKAALLVHAASTVECWILARLRSVSPVRRGPWWIYNEWILLHVQARFLVLASVVNPRSRRSSRIFPFLCPPSPSYVVYLINARKSAIFRERRLDLVAWPTAPLPHAFVILTVLGLVGRWSVIYPQ